MRRPKLYLLCSAVFVLGLVCSNGQTDNAVAMPGNEGSLNISRTQPEGATVVTHPTSVVAPLGDANATFNCTVENSELLRWDVNGLRFTDPLDIPVLLSKQIFQVGPTEDPQNRITSSVLVATTHDNNQTMIQCFARDENNVLAESNVAVLTIYGPPDPPTNVSVSELGLLQLNVSWTAVPTLPDVNVTYRINVTTLDTLEVFMSDEVTSTSFVFEGTEPSCDTYEFSVTAVNTAGESSPSDAVNGALPTLPTQPVSDVGRTVELLPQVTLYTFIFTAAKTCPAYPVTHYFLLLRNIETNTTLLLGPYPSVDTNRISVNTSDGIEDNSHYEYRIIAHNQVGALASELGEFYTTDVQKVDVDRENGLYIRCYFAQGSEALGCSVELVSPEDSVLWNITRENGSPVAERNITTALPAHCYNISVSELERDGIVGEVTVLVVEAEWDESCNPDSSSDSSSENDSLSTSGAASSVNPIIITAALLGGVLVLWPVVVVLIVAGHYHMMKAKRGKYLPSEKGCSVGHDNEYHVTQETNIPLYDPIENYLKKEESVAATEAGYCQPIDQLISPRQQNEDQVAATDSELSERVYSPLVPSSQKKQPTEEGTQNGHSPDYAQLNQFPIYHVLESNSAPSPVEFQPPEQPQITETSLHTVHSSSQEVQFTDL